MPLGVYFHVPFCAHTCDFCAFYQKAPRRQEILRYLDGMEMEWGLYSRNLPVETVFWGGGTPGLLHADDLGRLGEILLSRLGRPPTEWTVEMAPSTVKPDKVRALLALGVNRFSLGVQSFSPRWLEALGRGHGIAQVERAIDCLRSEGVRNLNLDMMFAIPGQTLDDWTGDLDAALQHGPEHISTYCLTFEEDTALWSKLQRGQVHRRSEDDEAEFYLATWRHLAEAGFAQYEVSNFARPGFECIHNINTWRMAQWIGVGPSASSQWAGRRFTNVSSLDDWLRGLQGGDPARTDVSELDGDTLVRDALVFGLRMNAGVDLTELDERFPGARASGVDELLNALCDDGYATLNGSLISLTDAGRIVVDRIGAELLCV